MLYQADWLLSPDAPPLPDGWIRVEGDRITAIGATVDLPVDSEIRKFPGCVLLPGLINTHCHLELTSLHNRLPPGKSFPVWVEGLRVFTAAFEPADYRASAREGVARLLRGGVTTVVDVGNTGEALQVLAESPLRAFGLVETLGLDPALAESRLACAKKLAGRCENNALFKAGVTPHAAYSCSPELFKAVMNLQHKAGLPITFHASESKEEAELFASASGPLQDYCRTIFSGSPLHTGTTPIRWLESTGLLPDHALIVHGNHLDAADMDILLRRKATVVHCPSSHAFFGHKPFPYRELKERGIPVCLGTDSLASGDSLSMLEQMRLFRKTFPEVTAQEALRMATVVAAETLGMGSELGKLKVRYKADFIVVQTGVESNSNPYEAALELDSQIVLSVINGLDVASVFLEK